MSTTLADLIATNDVHPLTRWLLNAIQRMKPSKEMLAAEASVKDCAVPAFRKVPGGLIEVNGALIGNSAGWGYLNGQTGKWKEMKVLIKEYLTTGKLQTLATEPAKATPSEERFLSEDSDNEALNIKFHGPVDVRKTWTNFKLAAPF